MLSHMYPSPVNWTGGIFVHEQVKALVALGHDVRVVSPNLPDLLVELDESDTGSWRESAPGTASGLAAAAAAA